MIIESLRAPLPDNPETLQQHFVPVWFLQQYLARYWNMQNYTRGKNCAQANVTRSIGILDRIVRNIDPNGALYTPEYFNITHVSTPVLHLLAQTNDQEVLKSQIDEYRAMNNLKGKYDEPLKLGQSFVQALSLVSSVALDGWRKLYE